MLLSSAVPAHFRHVMMMMIRSPPDSYEFCNAIFCSLMQHLIDNRQSVCMPERLDLPSQREPFVGGEGVFISVENSDLGELYC